MPLSINDLKVIVSNGGGVVIDARKLSPSDLKILASRASSTGAKIFLKSPERLDPSDLKVIASNSRGSVIFDFSGYDFY